MRGGWVQLVVAVAVILAGAAVSIYLISTRQPPAQAEQASLPPLVKVEKLQTEDRQMVVRGYGTVKPTVKADIVPQVGGKVMSVHGQLKAGGYIPAGEEIFKIDPCDYELAVEQARSAVAEAEVALEIQQAEADVARREWRTLNPQEEPDSPLVFREPQINQAQARLASARANLAKAELQLERTSVSLPYGALIIEENVDPGQYVTPGQMVGTAYGVEVFEIEVPLEDSELAWFELGDSYGNEGSGKSGAGSPAKVLAKLGGQRQLRQGHVRRTKGRLEEKSRMVVVVVEVERPFDTSSGKVPLYPGTFAEVEIQGRVLEDAVAIPRRAVHNGNEVWIVRDGRIHIQPIEIIRSDRNFVYTRMHREEPVQMVVSSLDTVTEGMKVRLAASNESNDD